MQVERKFHFYHFIQLKEAGIRQFYAKSFGDFEINFIEGNMSNFGTYLVNFKYRKF